MKLWRVGMWAFSLGQVNEALWLHEPVRAASLFVLNVLFIGLIELVCYLRRHLRWMPQPQGGAR